MPKYLVQASYTAQGAKGLLKDGGSKRRAVVDALVKSLGGSVEAFYYAFGATDAFIIVDLPDAATAAALSFNVSASGSVTLSTTPLMTAEEIDAACGKSVGYKAPGA